MRSTSKRAIYLVIAFMLSSQLVGCATGSGPSQAAAQKKACEVSQPCPAKHDK
jgi:hypothetical protein